MYRKLMRNTTMALGTLLLGSSLVMAGGLQGTVSAIDSKGMATVHTSDDEAEAIWHETIGMPMDRIQRLGDKENFWEMGETGPCGPCSEIHFDMGPEASEKGHEHELFPSDAGGRFVEI